MNQQLSQQEALNILISVAHQALGAGVFKTFPEVNVVQNAVAAFQQPAQQQEEQVGLKKVDASNLK
jgi:hypothetical protein